MRIAIFQRDAVHRQQIERVLTQCGHACMPFSEPLMLARTLAASTVDMLVLDWQGSRLAGSELVKTLRAVNGSQIPVLFVSEDMSDESVVRAFSVGADDYVCLPVCPSVLRARVNALLRRAFPDRYDNTTIHAGPYHFDMRRQAVSVHGKPVLLSSTQYRLASLFFANIGRVLSRDHIYAMVWGRELHTLTRTIDSHVSRLRLLLEIDEPNGFRLQPVYKSGYRLLRLQDEAAALTSEGEELEPA
ncbi:response regulator transcription factor [Paraburkholderia unamae]|uniref:Winged helix family two component transcriptional regulator n=1 Tax=Paraburkholderia unamae TaxID=219649 RepID=A0ABX5KIP0_9BURK|nr:response regulator transcription factor [Paraburkholderia unamae]PVX78795.1 winged helix family two component transcriptional regulator [Paraburkholderia unamae]CAG9244169.1 DNA-binding response regulator, OmpR family, contains REC and winged-helix (WHTH) domain [Paraburkholderia unamae]